MAAEQGIRECSGPMQGKGLFRLENKVDLYGLIEFCLKLSGFWNRAVRNYFDIQVVNNEVRLKNLPPGFDGYTILQLSDLHADLHPDFPARVKEIIAPLVYDCLALTGDFRTCTFGEHSGATVATIDILAELKQPKFAILGNHDFLAKVPVMEAAGIRFLLNEHILLRRGEAELCLIGIDDPNFYKTHNLERALDGAPLDVTKVLLSHAPQTYRMAEEKGIDLLIAGHTHGGQICLPGGYLIMHDHSAPRRILSGAWREGKLQGYTSQVLAAAPARAIELPAEVTLHKLRRG